MSSHLEELLAQQLTLAGLGDFVTQFKAVEGRRFAWDFSWPEQRLLVEVQGGTFARGKMGHSSGVGLHRDMEKANLATLAGWRVLSVADHHIKGGQALLWIQEGLREAV
jgi:very-short-patch-repair endonuclease